MKMNDSTAATEGSGTIQMSTADFDPLSDGNNNPSVPIDPGKLDLTDQSVERLSRKPLQKYRFIRSIGRGGMKMVLQVKDLDATRDVAMAVLPDAAARPHQDIVRFIQEARITASLEHPNIVPVHDLGVDATGAPYYTMKLLRGQTLASLIEKLAAGDPKVLAEYNTTRLLRIFLKICYGVAFAHSRGVIHLDLKPENIQVGDFGEVLVMDWGLAKLLEKNPEPEKKETESAKSSGDSLNNTTQDGIMKGTPGYMAPEQAAGKNSDKDTRTDIYSLGAILYTLMTWRPPLEQKEVRERIQATLTGNIIPPRERAPEREIPVAIEAVIMKAMSLHPDDRYQSVKELRKEVNAYIGGYATAAEKASIVKKSVLFVKRHLILMGFLIVILFLLTVGTTYMFQQHQRSFAGWRSVQTESYVKDSVNETSRPLRRQKNAAIVLNRGEYLWLDRQTEENLQFEMTVSLSDPAQTIRIFLKAEDKPVKSSVILPSNFVITLNDNGFDTVRRCGNVVLSAGEKKLTAGENRIRITLTGNQIEVSVNGGLPHLTAQDLVPARSSCGRVAVVSPEAPLEIRNLNLAVQTIPEQASPRLRGDILAEAGLYRRAIAQYLSVADLYPYDAFADETLADACRIAAFQLKDRALWNEIREKISSRPAFSYGAKIREYEALSLWQDGLHEEAFQIAEQILTGNPGSTVLESILALPHTKLPPQIGRKLLQYIGEYIPKQQWLDLSGYGLEDLTPIRHMKLKWLDVSGNPIRTPDVLKKLNPAYLKQ